MKNFLKKIFSVLGIQGKLTLIIILLSTLPIILVSIFTVNQEIKYKQVENIRDIKTDVKGLSERTVLFLTRIESEIMLVMKSTETKKILDDLDHNETIQQQTKEKVEKEFVNILTDNDYYLKINLLNKRGKEIRIDRNGFIP